MRFKALHKQHSDCLKFRIRSTTESLVQPRLSQPAETSYRSLYDFAIPKCDLQQFTWVVDRLELDYKIFQKKPSFWKSFHMQNAKGFKAFSHLKMLKQCDTILNNKFFRQMRSCAVWVGAILELYKTANVVNPPNWIQIVEKQPAVYAQA